jgi:putative ABC transport system permease protein
MWREIFQSIREHKARSILSGIGIAWGIFILIILLGIGNGFEKGVLNTFNSMNKKSVWVYCGQTSEEFNGLQVGRKITLANEDIESIKNEVKGIENISVEVSNWPGNLVTYKTRFGTYNIKGVDPDYFFINKLEAAQGRILNYLDTKNRRRIALIGQNAAEVLFKKKDPIGKYISIGGNYFMVAGVAKKNSFNPDGVRDVYIPFTSYKEIYGPAVSAFLYSTKENVDGKEVQQKIKLWLARKYSFSTKDNKTLFFNSIEDETKSLERLSFGLKAFLWFMGISTLLSGIIGIGNIMFVVVKERTKEIGVRKAIGATPSSIRVLILTEAVFFTFTAGMVGMAAGLGILLILNLFLEQADTLIKSASIDFSIAISAWIILIVSGALAGYIPANKAANISPILALKDE